MAFVTAAAGAPAAPTGPEGPGGHLANTTNVMCHSWGSMTDIKATKEDWKTEEAPEHLINISMHREYTAEEYKEIMLGIIPEGMDDKWFIYSESEWLFFHRSWTGAFVGKVKLQKEGPQYVATETWVVPNDEADTGEGHDSRLFEVLIDGLLLGRNATYFPYGTIANHALVGWGRSRRDKINPLDFITITEKSKSEDHDKNDT